MLPTGPTVVTLIYRTNRGGRWELDTRGLYDTWCLAATAGRGFRGFVIRSEEESSVPIDVIHTDTAEEGDAVLRTQFLNRTPSIHAPPHSCTGKSKPCDSPNSLSTTGGRTVFRHRVGWRGPSVNTASESRRGGARLFLEWEARCLPRYET